jgi:hypothetical protein
MLRELLHHILWLAVLFTCCAGKLLAQSVPSAPTSETADTVTQLVVLRNGEVLHGRVTKVGRRVLIILPGREISLRPADIDVVADTLDEAYRLKLSKTRPTDVEGRLDLAAWCIRHQLWTNAQEELSAARQVNQLSPRLLALEHRLQKAMAIDTVPPPPTQQRSVQPDTASADSFGINPGSFSWPPSQPKASGPVTASRNTTSARQDTPRKTIAPPESAVAMERFVEGLPKEALEQFTKNVHPMITRTCATTGCHAPGNPTEFTLFRLPADRSASRRLVHRNLYTTVQLVDFVQPTESRLLKVASQPHGPLLAGVLGDDESPKYRELVAWISNLTGVQMSSNDGLKPEGTAKVDWDRLQQSADRLAPLAQPASFGSAADGLQPNRPAEIKSAEPKTTIGRKSGRTPQRGRGSEKKTGTMLPAPEHNLSGG